MSITLSQIWNFFIKCVNFIIEGIGAIIKLYLSMFFTLLIACLYLFLLFVLARIAFIIFGVIL